MGKLAKRAVRDSIPFRKEKRGTKEVSVPIANDDRESDAEAKFIEETTTVRFQDEVKKIIPRTSQYQIARKLQPRKMRDKLAQNTLLNVDLLETVARIIDYTEIEELAAVPRTSLFSGVTRRSIVKAKHRLSQQSAELEEIEELSSLEEVEIDPWDHLTEQETRPTYFDPEYPDETPKQYRTDASLEFQILHDWWLSNDSDSKIALRKAKATVAIGRKSYQFNFNEPNKAALRRSSMNDFTITFFEEEMDFDSTKFLTRREYKISIGKDAYQRIWAYLQILLAHGSSKQVDIRFTPLEFAIMLFVHECNLIQVSHLGNNFVKYGTGATMVAHTFVLFCIEMPFLMKIMTMASYSQTFALHFFRSVPLLRGIGYCILVLFIILQSEVGLFVEAAFRMIMILVSSTSDWKKCPILVEDYKCIPFNSKANQTNCTKDALNYYPIGSEIYSTQYYINHVVFPAYNKNLPGFINHGVIVIWVVILLIAINGIALTKKATIRAQIVLMAFPVIMANFVLLARVYSISQGTLPHQYHFTPWERILSAEFVIDSISVGTKIYQFPFLVWICSMKPKETSVQVYTSLLIFTCIMTSWGCACLFISCIDEISKTYSLDKNCFHFLPRDHIFSLMPDLLLHMSFDKSWICLWFFFVLYFYSIYLVFSINVTVDTIVQSIPCMNRIPLIFCIAVWGMILILRYMRMNATLRDVFFYFQPENITIVTSILFGMLGFGLQFFYGQERFRDDFMFFNHSAPKHIWAITWHVIVYISSTAMICGIMLLSMHATNMDNKVATTAAVLELLLASFIFLTILYFFIRRSCYWLYLKRARESFNPDPKWGSPDPKMILLRKYYFSARDIRVRHHRLNCGHRCLVQAGGYKHLGYVQLMKVIRMKKFGTRRIHTSMRI